MKRVKYENDYEPKESMIVKGAGYNEKLDLHYDNLYQFGKTKVYIVAPKITAEENQRRWEHVCEIASRIAQSIAEKNK